MPVKTVINISPKVLTACLTGLGLAALGGIAQAIHPDTFSFLGVWAVPAQDAATVLIATGAAWLKREEAAADVAPAGAESSPPVAVPAPIPRPSADATALAPIIPNADPSAPHAS